MIDTHAHIFSEEFDDDRAEVVQRALDAGVDKVLLPNIDSSTIGDMMLLADAFPSHCYPMIGIHPCYVKENYQAQLAQAKAALDASPERFVAIGEIGTDLYWDKTFWQQQKEAFKIQCQWALAYDLPIVIHCRESIDETIEMVADIKSAHETLKGVFHCFTGSAKQAKKITDLGFCLGLGGVSTFKNAGMDQVIPHIDPSFIVFETDSPYLAPAPYRGKRNEPSYMTEVVKKVSEYLQVSVEDLDKLSTQNAMKLFNLKN